MCIVLYVHRYSYCGFQFKKKLFQTEAALMHDAVRVFLTVLREFNSLKDISPIPLRCTSTNRWNQGQHILRQLDLVKKKE